MAGALTVAVSERLDAPLLSLSPAEVTAELREDFACIQQLSARLLAVVQHASLLGTPETHGASSNRVWLAETLAISVRHASSLTTLAAQLPSVPVVADALAAGAVNVEQAQAIAATIADLPSDVGAESKANAAAILTRYAAEDHERPEILRRHQAMIMEMVAPEKAEARLRKQLDRDEQTAYQRRGLTMTRHSSGGYRLSALLDTEAAAIVRAALDPISAPGALRNWTHPHTTTNGDAAGGATDATPSDSTCAHALGLHHAGDNASGVGGSHNHAIGTAGTSGTDGAHHADANDANGAQEPGAGTANGPQDPGADGADGADDARDPGAGMATGADSAMGGADDDAVRDTRTAAARRADALTFLCQQVLTDGQLPESGGEKPHLVITMRWDDLRDRVGHGLLDTGDLLTPATVRRLACDAKLIPAILGGHGQILDVGRARRLIDGPLRRALVLRDRGCAWPGCDRPPRWTDGHHIRHWADGGPTSLDNAVLLCGHHHREVHKGQWAVRLAADGHPEFRPPPHIDPLQRWRRNRIHRRT